MSEIILTKFDDFYMVDIQGWSTSNMYLNGQPLDIAATGKRFTVKTYPEFTRKNTQGYITHWESNDDATQTMSVEQYQLELAKLQSLGYEDDDAEDYRGFANLDDEFAYRKFKAKWKPVIETRETFTPITAVVERHGMLQSEDFIEPMFCYDSNKPHLMIYNRTANIMHHFDELTKKYDLKWTRESHSGIYYWKLNGKYVFSNNDIFKLTNSTITGTLEQCRANRESDAKLIRSTIFGAVTPADQMAEVMVHDLRVKVSAAIAKIAAGSNARTASQRNIELNVAKNILSEAMKIFNNFLPD